MPRPRRPEPPRRQDRPVDLYVGSRLPVPDRPGQVPARRILRDGACCSDLGTPRPCGDQSDRRRCTFAAVSQPSGAINFTGSGPGNVRLVCVLLHRPSGTDDHSDCDMVALRSVEAVDGPVAEATPERWNLTLADDRGPSIDCGGPLDVSVDSLTRRWWSSTDLRSHQLGLDAPECGPLARNTL